MCTEQLSLSSRLGDIVTSGQRLDEPTPHPWWKFSKKMTSLRRPHSHLSPFSPIEWPPKPPFWLLGDFLPNFLKNVIPSGANSQFSVLTSILPGAGLTTHFCGCHAATLSSLALKESWVAEVEDDEEKVAVQAGLDGQPTNCALGLRLHFSTLFRQSEQVCC